jgi:site-specific DNA-methyltransferase (adenine-specific)
MTPVPGPAPRPDASDTPSSAVERLSQANRVLAQVSSASDAADVRDIAEAARVYARQMHLGTAAVNHATSIKVRAELRLAALVDEGQARGEIATPGGDTSNVRGPDNARPATLSALGLDRRRVAEARTLARRWTEPDITAATEAATAAGREVSRAELLGTARRFVRETTPAADPGAAIVDPGLCDWTSGDGRAVMLHGDFRDRLEALPDGSVDLIVTGPPYPTADLPLWSDLAKHSARLLGPRGILFAWSGKISLPDVLARLGEHLVYGCLFYLRLPGSHARILGRHIIEGGKPVLAYTTGTWPSGPWGIDELTSPSRCKERYVWEQTVGPAVELVKRYSPPSGLIVDPFCGVGTFGVAALSAGRRFLGVELDASRFATATARLDSLDVDGAAS